MLEADSDVEISAEVDFDRHGWYQYKTFRLKAHEKFDFTFPEGFSAHWIRFKPDKDCVATAWLVYE